MKKTIALIISIYMVCPVQLWESLAQADEEVKGGLATLRQIQVGPDRVNLGFSTGVKYNTFVTANPPRLVLELLNTRFGRAEKLVAGQGKYLKRVRSGQFSGDPNPVTRVVIDLVRPVDYRVAAASSQLSVFLGETARALTAADVSDDIVAEAKIVDAPAPSKASAPPAASPASGDGAGSAAAAEYSPKAKMDAAPQEQPLGQLSSRAFARAHKELTPEDAGSMAAENSEELTAMAAQRTALARPAASEDSLRPAKPLFVSHRPRRDIMSSLPRQQISLDFDNTDIGDILKLLAARAKINLIYGSDVNGGLSLHIADVPFNQAFGLVLSMKGLVATQEGDNILRIMTPESLAKERTSAVGVTRVFQLSYLKASDVKKTVDSVRSAEKRSGTAVADDKNNNLIITDTPEGLAAAERLLSQIDVRPAQVLIEAKLVEVSLNKDMELGIQWDYFSLDRARMGGQTGINTVGSTIFPTPNPFGIPMDRNPVTVTAQPPPGASGRGTGVLLPADKIFGAFTFGRITNNYLLSATLSAAAAQGKVKVLSDPKIATINGQQATINITTQIPYVTSTVASTGVTSQSVAYTTTGIQLTVTPTINADGRITLKVTPNVSKPSAVAASAGTTGAVAVDSRQADTNVIVRDGETIVIGGLITDSVSNTEGKIPLLGDIPLLGWLFKKKTVIRQRVELLVFVTTRVLPD